SKTERYDCLLPGICTWQRIVRSGVEAGNKIVEPTIPMFRKSQATPGFNDTYKQWWDLEMWFRLLEQGDFVYLSEGLSAFRTHTAQQSKRNRFGEVGQHEFWSLMKTYYANPNPWQKGFASQRMLINHTRYLKKRREPLDENTLILLPQIKKLIHPSNYLLCW